jgi:hypothetical protein
MASTNERKKSASTDNKNDEVSPSSFDLVWARKLARRWEQKAEREKKRREKIERVLVEESEECERLRWEVLRAKRALRMRRNDWERDGANGEEEGRGRDEACESAVAEKLALVMVSDEDEDDVSLCGGGDTRGEGDEEKEKEEALVVLEDGKGIATWSAHANDNASDEDSRPGRDRFVVVSAREEGLGTRENDDDNEDADFPSSERVQRVEQNKIVESDAEYENEVYRDLDDDERCLLGGRDVMEIEPMRSSDCAIHILLLMCEIVRFLRMESLPFDDEYVESEDPTNKCIERSTINRVSFMDSRRFSRMNSPVLSRSSIHTRSSSNAVSANRRISTIYDSKPSIGGGIYKRSTFFHRQGELNSANASPSIQYDLLRFVKSWFITSHGSHELATWHLRAFAATLRKLRKININNASTSSIATSHTPLARIFSRLLGCCQPLRRDERAFVMTAFSAMLPPERSALKVPLCKKTQTPMVFLDEAERGIQYAFRRNKIPTQLRSALRNHSVSSDGYTFQDFQQKYFAGSNDDRYAVDVGIALDLALTELNQLKKIARAKFTETFDVAFRHRVSKPLMHRPIVRTLLKEAGASGEEADSLAAAVFEACHEETKRMILKQRNNNIKNTNGKEVGAELNLEMGVLSKDVFAKCASEIVPGICLNDTSNENNSKDESNETMPSNSTDNDQPTTKNEHISTLSQNSEENSPSSVAMAPAATSAAQAASIEVVLSLDALAYAWNKTEAFIDKTLASRAETNFIGDDVLVGASTGRPSSTSSSSTTFALFKAQPADPRKRRDVDELFERAEKLRRTMSYALRAARALSRGTTRTTASSSPFAPGTTASSAAANKSASSCDENVKTAWSTYCGATCAFERAVQAHRAALGLSSRDDDVVLGAVSASSSFWF